ncbi:MAG: hypothetical protein P8L85_11825 [Rubripirellula sp.]|nr:hypothetical protein [Rubripirellula sp.]
MNLYLVPRLLGEEPQPHDMWHGCNLAEIEHGLDIPEELLELWDEEALQWAREVVNHPSVVDRVNRHIAIHHQLLTVRPSPLRTALVEEAFQLPNFEF